MLSMSKLFENDSQASMSTLFDAEKDSRRSMAELFEEPEVSVTTTPISKVSVVPKKEEAPSIFEIGMARAVPGFGEDVEFAPIITDEDKEEFTSTLGDLAKLAGQPYDVAKGVAGFFMHGIPSFLMGLGFAAESIVREGIPAIGGGGTVLDAYEIASEAFMKAMTLTEPAGVVMEESLEAPRQLIRGITGDEFTSRVLGLPEGVKPEMVAEVGMIPTIAGKPIHWLADKFEDGNIKGVLRFAGDAVSLWALGRVYHGGRAKAVADVKAIETKAKDIAVREEKVQGIPEEVVRRAHQVIIDIEKQQLALEAQKIQDSLDYGKMIREDLSATGSKVKGIKELPRKKLVDEQIDKAMREKVKEPKVEEPITETDLQTGTPEPVELSTHKSPFRTTAKKTKQMQRIYKRFNEKQIAEDPDLFIGKYINDVNRWLDGDKDVDINFTRKALSDIATRVDELRYRFAEAEDPVASFENFKDLSSEAAIWARRADRLKIEPSIDLNMMIPLDRMPKQVLEIGKSIKGFMSDRGILAKNIFRNKELFDKTGFWFGKDLKWRYELDDSEVRIRRVFVEIGGRPIPLKDAIDHPQLFEAIPELKDVSIRRGVYTPGSAGEYLPSTRTIFLKMPYKETLVHELQHAINDIMGSRFKGTSPEFEGLTKGLSKTGAYRKYLKDPGEMEARLTERRMGMSSKQRRKEPPWETLDELMVEEHLIDEVRGTDPGTKLYSGIPLDKIADELVSSARKFANYTKRARGMKAFKPKIAAQMVKEEFVRSFIDRSGNIRRKLIDELSEEGYKIAQSMYLSKGASSLAAENLKQMMKEVGGGLSRAEKVIRDNLILAERMVAIGKYKTKKEFKFPKDIEPENSALYIELFEQIEKMSPDRAAEVRNRVKAHFEWMKKPLKEMLDAELISEKEYNDLVSHNYRQIKLVEVFDKRQPSLVKKGRTIYDSGIEALAKGRDTDVFEPSSEIMALEVFNRAYGRILNNEANKTLLSLAKRDKENAFVRVKEEKGDKIPSGWNRFFVYEEGQRKAIYLSPEMSKEWIVSSPEMTYRLSQLVRYASGSPVLRTFATGINWGFALANLPRDVMHTWYAARVFEDGKWKPLYSSHMPVFAAEIGRDLATTSLDAVVRGGRYKEYMKEGGGMEFLVHQGRIFQRGRHLEGPIDKINDFLGYLGETSELMTRLAIRERVIRRRAKEKNIGMEKARKDKDITREATFAARDYMDFGQGGGITKAADNAIPYLNAAVQGTRGLLRAFKDNPVASTYKLSQFALLTTGLYVASQRQCPETMKALRGNISMQNNLCLPLSDSFGFEDEKGQMRYPYLKMPLDPGQKFFKTFFEASTDKWLGNEVDINRVVDSLKEQSPVSVSELPPAVSGVVGYMTNKDFWLNEDIWRKTEKPFGWPESKEEYIPGDTPLVYRHMGDLTKLSPERLRYAVEELTTSGTIWSYLAGRGYDKLFAEVPKEQKEQQLAMVLSRMPVIRRFFGVTNPYSQYAGKIEEAEEKSAADRWIQNRELDRLTQGYLYEDSYTKKDIKEYAKSFKDRDVYNRLIDDFEFQEKAKGLPNRAFWLRLRRLPVDARAKVYVDVMDAMSEEERAEVRAKEIPKIIKVGGVITSGFREEVRKLRGE